MQSVRVKSLLAIGLIICLVLALAGCGGNSASKEDAKQVAEAGTEENGKEGGTVPDSSQEMTIKTGIGKEGGEVTATTGQNLAWEADKMGGMPQPEGVTVFLAMDLTKTLGLEFAYSYSLNGLTKESFEEYTKLVSERFPKLLESTVTDTEGTYMASSSDGKESFLVTFNSDKVSLVQYHNN